MTKLDFSMLPKVEMREKKLCERHWCKKLMVYCRICGTFHHEETFAEEHLRSIQKRNMYLAIMRDKGICRLCGSVVYTGVKLSILEDFGFAVSACNTPVVWVHHLAGHNESFDLLNRHPNLKKYAFENQVENLLTICQKCHDRTHGAIK